MIVVGTNSRIGRPTKLLLSPGKELTPYTIDKESELEYTGVDLIIRVGDRVIDGTWVSQDRNVEPKRI